jgi:hypothetical protein
LSSIFSLSFHFSTDLSVIFSLSFHFSTDLSVIFAKSFHYFLPYFSYLFTIFSCIFQICWLFSSIISISFQNFLP